MELNDLIIFKTVVTEGSISGAAKKLGYVQPNITERIKKLEQELATSLLHRHSKGITLLPSGDTLLDYTNKILNLVEEAKTEIKRVDVTYRIATTQAILVNYLSPLIKGSLDHYQIYLENTQNLLDLLKAQSVDMVMSYLEYSDPVFQKVVSPTLMMGLQKAKGPSDLNYFDAFFFVSRDPHCPFRTHTLTFMEEHEIPKKQLQQVDSYSLIEDFVAQGMGVAFLPLNPDKLENVADVQNVQLSIHFYTYRGSKKSVPSELLG